MLNTPHKASRPVLGLSAHLLVCVVFCAGIFLSVLVSGSTGQASTTIRIPEGAEAAKNGARPNLSDLFGKSKAELELETEKAKAAHLDLMIGSMIMMGFQGFELKAGNSFFEAVREGKVGHVILFNRDVLTGRERNIQSPQQLSALTRSLQSTAPGPLLIAVDQEGGKVRRLRPEQGFLDLPSAKTLGRGDAQSTRVLASRLGYELSGLGISVNLAPAVDVDINPHNPAIGKLERSFSPDPAAVARHGLAFGAGLWEAGVIPTLKHFPGQGSAQTDSHLALPDIGPEWSSPVDLRPYVDAFKNGWPGMVLVGHMFHPKLDPSRPTTLSPKIINGLLRTTLGWDGVVISDDLQMRALTDNYSFEDIIFMAVEAGNDILMFGNNLDNDPTLHAKVFDALSSMVQSGRIPKARIEMSWQRIAALHAAHKARLASALSAQR